jgi:hypothetical protein
MISGKYMKTKFSLCHKPSFWLIVFLNSGFLSSKDKCPILPINSKIVRALHSICVHPFLSLMISSISSGTSCLQEAIKS